MFETIHERWGASEIALWEKVRAEILAHPEEFDQTRHRDCIAGLAHKHSPCSEAHIGWPWFQCAAEWLGLKFTESLVVFSAFPVEWPDPFRAINCPADPSVKAGIAAAYIDWIVRNGRVQ